MTDVVYVGIGNSDDKLSQRRWAEFAERVFTLIKNMGGQVLGAWYSSSASQFQNACFCFAQTGPPLEIQLKLLLRDLAQQYGQDRISWVTGETEFLTPLGEEAPTTVSGSAGAAF